MLIGYSVLEHSSNLLGYQMYRRMQNMLHVITLTVAYFKNWSIIFQSFYLKVLVKHNIAQILLSATHRIRYTFIFEKQFEEFLELSLVSCHRKQVPHVVVERYTDILRIPCYVDNLKSCHPGHYYQEVNHIYKLALCKHYYNLKSYHPGHYYHKIYHI